MPKKPLQCPFCQFTDAEEYFLQLHIEELHTEDSPFVVSNEPVAPSSRNHDIRNEELVAPSSIIQEVRKNNPFRSASSSMSVRERSSRPSSSRSKEQAEDQNGGRTDSPMEEEEYVLCPNPACGEQVMQQELSDHLDMHLAEQLSYEDDQQSSQSFAMDPTIASDQHRSFVEQHFTTDIHDNLRSTKQQRHDRQQSTYKTGLSRKWTDWIIGAPKGQGQLQKPRRAPPKDKSSLRLGRTELGPYAWEDRMPKWLYTQLEKGPRIIRQQCIGRDGRLVQQEIIENETAGILPVLGHLIAMDDTIKEAWLCHPGVRHVGKEIDREGGFCGYRNIQMLMTYISSARAQGHQRLGPHTPRILTLQDWIEDAWDKDCYSIGREQTGGIRGTRKYIGTPEAHALFSSLGVDINVNSFHDNEKSQAYEQLLVYAEAYFKKAASDGSKVHKTLMAPIYLQQPGHSITIVGVVKLWNRHRRLLVLDPMFKTSPAMKKLLGRQGRINRPQPDVLDSYTRKGRSLMKHKDFETLILSAEPPMSNIWDDSRWYPYPVGAAAFHASLQDGIIHPINLFRPPEPALAPMLVPIHEDYEGGEEEISQIAEWVEFVNGLC